MKNVIGVATIDDILLLIAVKLTGIRKVCFLFNYTFSNASNVIYQIRNMTVTGKWIWKKNLVKDKRGEVVAVLN
jgi:hypothetical protein